MFPAGVFNPDQTEERNGAWLSVGNVLMSAGGVLLCVVKGSDLPVAAVCMSSYISVLYVSPCVFLPRIHTQVCYWPSLQKGKQKSYPSAKNREF